MKIVIRTEETELLPAMEFPTRPAPRDRVRCRDGLYVVSDRPAEFVFINAPGTKGVWALTIFVEKQQ